MLVSVNYAHSNAKSLANLVVTMFISRVYSHIRLGKRSQNSSPREWRSDMTTDSQAAKCAKDCHHQESDISESSDNEEGDIRVSTTLLTVVQIVLTARAAVFATRYRTAKHVAPK